MTTTAYTPEFAVEGCQDPGAGAVGRLPTPCTPLHTGLIVTPSGKLCRVGDFPCLIGLYRGLSPFSRAIQLRTWSPYSHVSWIRRSSLVVEAWVRGGVRQCGLHESHTPGTVVDCFRWPELSLDERDQAEDFLLSQVGKPYDFRGALGFVTRTHSTSDHRDKARWFCSELVFAASEEIGRPLLMRIPAWKISPGLISLSPKLEYVGQLITGEKS